MQGQSLGGEGLQLLNIVFIRFLEKVRSQCFPQRGERGVLPPGLLSFDVVTGMGL